MRDLVRITDKQWGEIERLTDGRKLNQIILPHFDFVYIDETGEYENPKSYLSIGSMKLAV